MLIVHLCLVSFSSVSTFAQLLECFPCSWWCPWCAWWCLMLQLSKWWSCSRWTPSSHRLSCLHPQTNNKRINKINLIQIVRHQMKRAKMTKMAKMAKMMTKMAKMMTKKTAMIKKNCRRITLSCHHRSRIMPDLYKWHNKPHQ